MRVSYGLLLASAGLGSGFVSGLFGVGGGIVRVPLFVYLLPLFGVPFAVKAMIEPNTARYAIASTDCSGTCAGRRSPVTSVIKANPTEAHSICAATFIGPGGMS